MTSAAEGGGLEMLTVADTGGGGLSLGQQKIKILKFWQKLIQIKRSYHYA